MVSQGCNYYADNEGLPDCADVQSDLSLRKI